MKRLYAHQNPLLLEQIADELSQIGIASILRNMSMTGQAAGELPPIVCWPEIWVCEDADLEPARQALAKMLESLERPGDTWQCSLCGERLEPQFGACWRCASNEDA